MAVVFLFLFTGSVCAGQESVQYLAVFIDGQKVGYAVHSRIADGNEVRTSDDMSLEIMRYGNPIRVATSETNIESLDGKPLGFESVMDASIYKTFMKGSIDANGTVRVVSRTGQFTSKKEFQWPDGALMADGIYQHFMTKGMDEGTSYSAKLFSPSLLQAMDMKVTIGSMESVDLLGKQTELRKVLIDSVIPMAGLIETVSYVDEDGTALKTYTSLMGMKMELIDCDKEFALSENSQADIMVQATTPSPIALKDIHEVEWISYKIRPNEGVKDFHIPDNDNQSVRKLGDGTLVVKVRPVEFVKGAKLGYQGDDTTVLAALAANQYVQSDDKRIIAKAKEVVGNTKDSEKAVRRIEKFVSKYIENRTLSVGYASATEVFDTRKGDCTEFAVLTAAMCQAVGVPARIVVGLAYVDEFMNMKQSFGGHAWTEVYISGKWIGVDSAFKASGRGGYDAGHIALSFGTGELIDSLNVIFTIGQFKIEEVYVKR